MRMKAEEIEALLAAAEDGVDTVHRECGGCGGKTCTVTCCLIALVRSLCELRPMSDAPRDGTDVIIFAPECPPQVMHWYSGEERARAMWPDLPNIIRNGWRLSGGAPDGASLAGEWFDGWLPLPPVVGRRG